MDWDLLEFLSQDDKRAVLSLARRRRFAKGEVLFHEGDPGDTLHLLERGHVAMRISTPMGDIATLLVAGPGAYFGELTLVSTDAKRNSTVVALDAVETLTITREQLAELRTQHRNVESFLVAALAEEVRRLSARLSEALFVPVDKRIYRRLLELTTIYPEVQADGAIHIPLIQDDLATMAGTTRPTANKIVKAAEEAGIVRTTRGRIDVIDVPGLERRAR